MPHLWTLYAVAKNFPAPLLDFPHPPCEWCKLWRPIIKSYRPDGTPDEVICCHSENMYADFSCYMPKKEAI